MYPAGACSYRVSRFAFSVSSSMAGRSLGESDLQESLNGGDGLVGCAELWAVSGCLHQHERAARRVGMDILTDMDGCDHVILALQNERGHRQLGEIVAVIGEKGDGGKLSGDLRIGPAKAVGELCTQFRPLGIAHDDRSKMGRPGQVVALLELEELVDVGPIEAACVRAVVDVARRRANKNQLA